VTDKSDYDLTEYCNYFNMSVHWYFVCLCDSVLFAIDVL